jgi:hypothetical protein
MFLPPHGACPPHGSEADVTAARTAAVLAAAGFLVIATFQVALALGVPLGHAAWGGQQERLLTRLRIGSAVAAVIWILAALIVLGRAGFAVSPLPDVIERWGTWILVGLLPVGALMNISSSSRWERYLWGPFASTLAVLTLVVALNARS